MLNAMQAGEHLNAAIAAAAAATTDDGETLRDQLKDWFRTWTVGRLFRAIEPPSV
ncbi:MAG: hypothetical protein R3B90_23110 [Planctomycetaceae bacterium]